MNRKTVIALSGLNSDENPGPGVGVARCLKEALGEKVSLVGLAYGPSEGGNYVDSLFDTSFILPSPQYDDEDYFARLCHIHEELGLDMVIPNLDAELPFFQHYEKRLIQKGIHVFLPSANSLRRRSKESLPRFTEDLSVKVPQTVIVDSANHLEEGCREIGFPLLVKGRYYNSFRASNLSQAKEHFSALCNEWGVPIILQKPVEGNEINLLGLGDGEGNLVSHVSMKKVSTTQMGKVASCVTIHNDNLLKAAQELCRKLCWRGPFELECIEHKGDIYLIEINPRFASWVYLTCAVGRNIPAMMVDLALGDNPSAEKETANYEPGKFFMRVMQEMVVDFSLFQNLVTDGCLHVRENPVLAGGK